MKLKAKDTVILRPDCGMPDTLATPHFGGKYGKIYGVVNKILTGEHDPALHRAEVRWSTGCGWKCKESDLTVINTSAIQMVEPKDGLYIFLRPTPGTDGLRIGMVSEDFEPGVAQQSTDWVCIQTMSAIPPALSEEEVLSHLSTHLPVTSTHATKVEAVNQVLSTNRFPLVTASEVEKVPLFNSLQEARQSEGSCRDRGYLIFTLPSE